MHSRISGLSDYFAARRARLHPHRPRDRAPTSTGASSGRRRARRPTSRSTTPTSCSASRRSTSACRSTRARCSPASSTARASTSSSRPTARAWSPAGRRSTATRSASSPTRRACCSWRRRRRPPSSSCSPTRSTRRSCSSRTSPATWSASEYEQAGIIKDGAKMINAVTNSTVPHLTVMMGASYGAGNYGMCGRALRPALPVRVAELEDGGDGPAAARRRAVDRRPRVGRSRRARVRRGRPTTQQRQAIEEQIERESHAFFTSGKIYDDGIIDPRDTRTVLGIALSAVHSNVVEGRARLRRVPDVTVDDRRPSRSSSSPTAARSRCRVMRTARELGIATVAVFSDPDARRAVRARGRRSGAAARQRGRPTPTCAATLIVDAARRTGADAVHPGLRLPGRERRVRARVRRRPASCSSGPPADVDRGDGLEARGEAR